MPNRDALQRMALRHLAEASDEIVRYAEAIRAEMCGLMEQVRDGQHARSLNHQTPFDLQAALTKRKLYLSECLALDITTDAINMASTGRWP